MLPPLEGREREGRHRLWEEREEREREGRRHLWGRGRSTRYGEETASPSVERGEGEGRLWGENELRRKTLSLYYI
jgi:hypothetical protein